MSFIMVFWTFIAVFAFRRMKRNKQVQTVVDDETIVGHASYSDTEEEDDGPMRDFYEETTMSPRWMALTDEEKKERLDREIYEYVSKGKNK